MSMIDFRFAYPLVLAMLVLPLLVYVVPSLRRWRPQPGVLRYSDVRLLRDLPVGWRVRLRRLPDVLRLLAWMLLVLALARPQTGSAREVIQGQGIDIVLALDISSSMAATDFVPNRLAAAKGVIADFIAERDFDRIGLVVFARSAYHQAPPTLDYDVLLTLLEQVSLVTDLREVEGRSLDGTAVGLGLASSANMLRGEEQAPSQVIVLLTDGDNNAGLDPLQAAEAAAALGIRIYTIGMGRTGRVEIPDQEGNLVPIESNLDEETLREIAQTADGLYFRAEDENALQAIYDQIDTFERSDAERVIYVRWRDLAFPWMLVALGLMVGDRVLRHTVFQVVP